MQKVVHFGQILPSLLYASVIIMNSFSKGEKKRSAYKKINSQGWD